ncbi:MAG TPA: hypothetical protein EYO40_09480 [Phycisphaerales bacterium]|nr:hypothetical protein [Phycisphaerales bacterium]HIN84824.1 hypothetical protein [Phycisphaerales bacterium]HIO20143.1 hypothetical protein [Phycisphaerales bacterium]
MNIFRNIPAFLIANTIGLLASSSYLCAATINVPADFATIQGAIDASSNGDTIAIAAGTYYEFNINPNGKAITIYGDTDVYGMPAVTIDAQQQGRVVECSAQETSSTVFANLVITGGNSQNGGGMAIIAASPIVENCTFTNNAATIEGGGVYTASSAATFISCRIIGNTATRGGGLKITGSKLGGNDPTLIDCIIAQNTGQDGGEFGGAGGIDISGNSGALLTTTTVCGNWPSQIEGPWQNMGGSCAQGDCVDSDGDGLPDICESDEDGILHVPSEYGAIQDAIDYALNGETVLIQAGTYSEGFVIEAKSITISGETNTDGTPAVTINGYASVFNSLTQSIVIENLHFFECLGYLGGAMAVANANPAINNCVFTNNVGYYYGGAIAFVYECNSTLTNCTFIGNQGGYSAGALYISTYVGDVGPNITMVGCVLEGNAAPTAGAIYIEESSLTLVDCEITGNVFTDLKNGMGGGIDAPASILNLTDTTVCGNTPNQINGEWTDLGGNTIADVCAVVCPADINGDGSVNVSDILLMISAWGPCDGCAEDIDGSGEVNVTDLLTVIGAWGDC